MSPLLSILIILIDVPLLIIGTMRLTRFFIVDDLGRRMLIPLESALRTRLGESKQWVADGFICPFCIGMWIGTFVIGTYVVADLSAETWGWPLLVWRLIFGALALNYVAAHLVSLWDIYDGDDDQEAR
jgi:hypothetical protein